MNGVRFQNGDSVNDSDSAYRAHGGWRYACGFVFGLACAGVVIACSIPFVESLIWRFMERGPDDQLRDGSVLLGWTIIDLITSSWVGLLVAMPLAGTLAQRKPLITALDSWQSFAFGVACAVLSLGVVLLLLRSHIWHWVYLYHS